MVAERPWWKPKDPITLFPVLKPGGSRRPYVVLAVLQVLDVLTTGLVLAYFEGSSEGNPLVASLFSNLGLALGLLVLLVAKLAAVYLFWRCQTGVRLSKAIYGLVVFNNLLFMVLWMVNR